MSEIKVQICLYGFDLLYLNGEVSSAPPPLHLLVPIAVSRCCLGCVMDGLQSLVREPFRRRRELLHNSFIEVDDEFMFARYSDANTIDVRSAALCCVLLSPDDPSLSQEIESSLHESVAGNCEGLMIKRLDDEATYQPSKRSYSWLKVLLPSASPSLL
jgi:DNA ligase-1